MEETGVLSRRKSLRAGGVAAAALAGVPRSLLRGAERQRITRYELAETRVPMDVSESNPGEPGFIP
jgi:hypothetical protein